MSSENVWAVLNETETEPKSFLEIFKLNTCDSSENTESWEDNLDKQSSSNQNRELNSCDLSKISFDSISCIEMLTHNCEKPYRQETVLQICDLDTRDPSQNIDFSMEDLNEEISPTQCRNRNSCDQCKIIFESFLDSVTHCSRKLYQQITNETFCKNNGSQPSAEEFQITKRQKILSTTKESKRHSRKHSGVKQFQCQICALSFIKNDHLKRHKLTHNERPFKCEVCQICFVRSCDLKKHMLTHTGERPFKCEVCLKCFSRSCNLKQHMLTHTGERPFKCEVCQKSFVTRSNWKNHQITHTSEKSYKCEVCEKCFARKHNLKKHARIFHLRKTTSGLSHSKGEFKSVCKKL